jgi:hypothetical protein
MERDCSRSAPARLAQQNRPAKSVHNEGVRRTRAFASAVAAVVAGAGMCLAQVSSTVSLSNGVEVEVTANLGQPTGEEKLTVDMARASGNSFYRIFKDQNNLMVFAYELSIGLSSDGKELHFTAKPAEAEFAARYPGADAGKPVPSLSSDHDFRPLQSGDGDQIGLFEIPGMGLSVTDAVKVTLHPEGEGAGSGGPLRFAGINVSINGMPAAGPARASVSGRYAMFYLPGRGAFFFATEAPPGRAFVKAGSIDHNRMQFTVNNDSYECIASDPVLANAESGEVWVFQDPGYEPAGNWTQEVQLPAEQDQQKHEEFFTAASDSLSWWLP